MGWTRATLETIECPAEFYEQLRGHEWRAQRLRDSLAEMVLPLLLAQGVKREGGEMLTLTDLLGRDPVRLIDPRPLTEEEQAEDERQAAEIEARKTRTMLQMHRAHAERAAREGRGPEVVG